MRAIWSPGVAGLYTPQAALQKLLSGTGIGFHLTGPDQALLEIQGLATSVDVTDTSVEVSLPKFTQPLVDTPQSIDIVPQHVIQDQGAPHYAILCAMLPASASPRARAARRATTSPYGVSPRATTFSSTACATSAATIATLLTCRRSRFCRARRRSPSAGDLRAASSIRKPRFPSPIALFAGTVELGTDQTKRITADLDRPLPSLGSGTAFRLNLLGHDSKFAGRDIAENRRYGVAPSLAFGLGTPTRLTLSYLLEGSDDTPDYGIPWLFNGPAPVERRNYYGFQHGNYLKTNVDLGTVKFEHDFNSRITFRNQARYAHYTRDVRITEAQIDATTLDTDPLATPLGQIGVIRNQIAVNSTETFLQDQADVTLKFRTGLSPSHRGDWG